MRVSAGSTPPSSIPAFSGWETPPDIAITLPMPPSTNDLHEWRGGQPRRSKKYAQWLVDVEWLGVVQRAADKVTGNYAMRVTGPRSRLDLDNCIKALSDGLQRMRVVGNDKHAQAILLQVDPVRAEPTVLVELWALA
jgi:Holliday junction resolvase RusA-like endonuclease